MNNRFTRSLQSARLVAFAMLMLFGVEAQAESFTFFALGDTGYDGAEYPKRFYQLIDLINAANPAFSIHVGDIWGSPIDLPCPTCRYRVALTDFQRFNGPVVYTPGDNEWTDCVRYPPCGGALSDDPNGKLKTIRQIFFKKRLFHRATSLGQNPMPVVRQADVSQFKLMVENMRWEQEGVIFATVNVPGGNNYDENDNERLNELKLRTDADVAWIAEAFDEARNDRVEAVVIAMQAIIYPQGRKPKLCGKTPCYQRIVDALSDGTTRVCKPVLVIHGDGHQFLVDHPVPASNNTHCKIDFTRLMVPGGDDRAVAEVRVDTSGKPIFSINELKP